MCVRDLLTAHLLPSSLSYTVGMVGRRTDDREFTGKGTGGAGGSSYVLDGQIAGGGEHTHVRL